MRLQAKKKKLKQKISDNMPEIRNICLVSLKNDRYTNPLGYARA